VRCFDENNTAIYTNVFSFVPTKRNVEEGCAERVKKYSKNKNKIEELSILKKFECLGHPHYKEFYIHAENISSI
jgi:hypothetical protein